MGSVASDLKLEREKRKISLAQIAADTRISLRHLQSLEDGRFGDLPGGIYSRAFLKAYCESLNIDQQEILRRYEAEVLPPFEKSTKAKAPVSPPETSVKPSPIVIWSLMLLISATGVFFSRKWIAAVFSPYFSHAPVSSVRYETAPTIPDAPVSPAPTPSTAEPVASPPQETAPSTSPLPTASSRPVETAVATATGGSPPSTQVSPSALRLELAVTEKCWVSVVSDGASVFRRLMEPGEMQSFGAAESFRLIVGNAGGLQLKVNGKLLKPLGKQGEVVKMLIDSNSLQNLPDQTTG
jgi:cytoskeleton protein RodZ